MSIRLCHYLQAAYSLVGEADMGKQLVTMQQIKSAKLLTLCTGTTEAQSNEWIDHFEEETKGRIQWGFEG